MTEDQSLKYRFLSDEESTRLYQMYPDLVGDPTLYCPTCNKEGQYLYQGELHECDCVNQLQLLKHYLNAGVGAPYHRTTWEDYEGDPAALALSKNYINLFPSLVTQGKGLVFCGEYGTGKTMLASLILKELLKRGYKCFSTTYTNLIEMYTAGWKSYEEKSYFSSKIDNTRCLLVDDLGKERTMKSDLALSLLDQVLRTRMQQGRPTFVTSNLSLTEIKKVYGDALFSLLHETSFVCEVKGSDYRITASRKQQELLMKREVAPLV